MSSESFCAVNATPPRVAGDYAVQSVATAVAAVGTDLWAGYTADASGLKTPPGKIWMEFEAVGFDVYFRLNSISSTGTTSANGRVLKVGTPQAFYLDPTKDLFVDHLGAGVGTLKWRKMGPIGERIRA